MINDIPKFIISPEFTIEDIYRIREWHYEILKDATPEEQRNFFHDKAKSGLAQIEAIRSMRKAEKKFV